MGGMDNHTHRERNKTFNKYDHLLLLSLYLAKIVEEPCDGVNKKLHLFYTGGQNGVYVLFLFTTSVVMMVW